MTELEFFAGLSQITQSKGITRLRLETDLLNAEEMKRIALERRVFRVKIIFLDGKHEKHDLDNERVLQR